jgi:dipeptidyl aminopeptidase/acylaminoacyl peptidase
MAARGITAVVNMRLEFDDSEAGIAPPQYLYLPVADDHAPSLEQLRAGTEFIGDEVAKGGSVYVHCGSGVGRAATMAAAYLISTGLTKDEAWAKIRTVRPFIRPTAVQLEQIEHFATRVVPYGSWKSPIGTDLIASEIIRLDQIALDGEDVYWLESRPTEGGRCVIVRRTADGETMDINAPPYNARTRVHEYGGGAYFVADGKVCFSHYDDQRLYWQKPGSEPQAITPGASSRYADGIFDEGRGQLICVCEDHINPAREAVNTLVSLTLDGSQARRTLVSGSDFYASPRLSPDGCRLAWLSWNHPNMPWDGTELWVAELDGDGATLRAERVAGGVHESIFQPEWSPDGILYFVSDRTGWWNLYRWQRGAVEQVTGLPAEFGLPQWVFGMSTYAFESAQRIICAYTQQGTWHLASLDTVSGELERFDIPYTHIAQIRAMPGRAVFLAATASEFPAVVQLDLVTGQLEILQCASDVVLQAGTLSNPEPIQFPTSDGFAHALLYEPRNEEYMAPSDERPPLLVLSHGGPTGATSSALNPTIQYWTSRGIAVLDVNYGGSTGYGRDYRQRLDGRWGIVDVDDCVNGALTLVDSGRVDRERLAIRGGSAGGYTTLCALTFRDVFRAGASYFGVSDLEALAKETHKFESHYLDRLVGPYPESRDLYVERSPIYHVDRLSCPVIFFQGLEDRVVPPNQAETMFEALRVKGVPVAYLAFEGEQHGFRRTETIKRTLEAELYFYSRVFGFELTDSVDPVPIENSGSSRS